MSSRTPRSIRLNNPGNIRITSPRTPWQGRVPTEQLTDGEFEQFISPEWGARAMARTLITYQDRHNLRTIRALIGRWAPPKGKNADGSEYAQATDSYIAQVSARAGIGPDEIVDMQRWDHARPIVDAMILHEGGHAGYRMLDQALIDQGLVLAGIKPHERALLQTKTGAGIGIAGLATLAAEADIQGIAAQIEPVSRHSDIIAAVVGGLVVFGLLLALYGRWQAKRRTGL